MVRDLPTFWRLACYVAPRSSYERNRSKSQGEDADYCECDPGAWGEIRQFVAHDFDFSTDQRADQTYQADDPQRRGDVHVSPRVGKIHSSIGAARRRAQYSTTGARPRRLSRGGCERTGEVKEFSYVPAISWFRLIVRR